MHNSYRIAVENFEKETGSSYNDAAYPTPTSVPKELRNLVAEVKMYGTMARLNEIRNELSEYVDNNGIARVPQDKEYLMDELKECQEREDVWAKVLST